MCSVCPMLALRSTARNARSGRRAARAHVGGPYSSRPLFTHSGSSFPFYPVHPSLFFSFSSPEQIYNPGCCGGSHDASSPAVEREERGDLRFARFASQANDGWCGELPAAPTSSAGSNHRRSAAQPPASYAPWRHSTSSARRRPPFCSFFLF